MKITALFFAAILVLSGTTAAQLYPPDTIPAANRLPVPRVKINDRAVAFQSSLYPEFYKTNSVLRDLRWVQDNDSLVAAFWEAKGDSILYLLSEYSGLDWVEQRFDLYLLRFYPSMGDPEPLVLPLGGLRRGMLTIAAPENSVLQLDLIYQLSHRMLLQVGLSDDPFVRSLAGHPLMQQTPYRRDNLALLLTLVTAQKVIGLDSTFAAYQSAFIKQRTPGREIFEKYLLSNWLLSPERTLAQYLSEEPSTSELVRATRPPRRLSNANERPREHIEGLPLKGELGFSVKTTDNNRLVVDKIDVTRLAYASGLREGDIIRSVDGKRTRTQKDLIENILNGLDEGGATVAIQRDSEYQTIVIQPMAMYEDEGGYFMWEEFGDSLYQQSDTVPFDTTGAGPQE